MAAPTRITLYDPFPHQLAAHDLIGDHLAAHPIGDPARQAVFDINAMRQVGKTMFVANELGRLGFTMPGAESIYISPTFELAKKMLNDFSKSLAGTALIKSMNKTDRQIVLFNDHIIRFISAEQGDSVRGLNVSGVLVIDELAYIRQSFLDDVVAPFTDFHAAPTIAISTPRTKRDLHWQYQCLGKIPGSGVYAIDWAGFDLSYLPSRSPEKLEQRRARLPGRTFRTDYLGEFLDSESTVFGDLKAVTMPKGFRPTSERLYWGLDWATGASKDRTVLTAYNENNAQVFIKEWTDTPPMQQVKEIAAILNANAAKTERVVAEKNSIGAVYIDALRAKVDKIAITEFNTTNETKRRIVEDVVMLIEQNEMQMLHNDTQTAEFEFFELHEIAGGKITYSAPLALHDDYVMATCLALSGRGVVNAWM